MKSLSILVVLTLFCGVEILGSSNVFKKPAQVIDYEVKLIDDITNMVEVSCALEFQMSGKIKVNLSVENL